MSFGNNPTTTTQGTLATNQIPLGSVAEPGRANGDLTTLEGGPGSVDSNGNRTAPVSTYAKDGNDVTQGTSTDANTANTVMGRLTKIRDLLLSVLSFNLVDSAGTNKASVSSGGAVKVDNSGVTQPVSGTFFQATQPVSAASLPLPTGAAIEAGHLATIDTSTAASKTDLDTIVTNTNKIPASPATEGGNLATLAGAIAAAIMQANVKQINGITPLMGNGITGTGSQRVTIASDNTAFSTNAVQSGTWTVQPGNTANTTPWLVQEQAGTAGGSTFSHTISASGTNATNLKNAAGMVYGFSISNSNASARFFRLYNTSTAPTVGTTASSMTVQVPGNSTVIRVFPIGLVFGTGISWGLSTGIADNDTGAVGTDISVDIDYH